MKSFLLASFAMLAVLYTHGAAIASDGNDAIVALERPCTEKDLDGTYVLISFKESPEGAESNSYALAPYQYLGFYPNHSYAQLVTNRPVQTPERLNRYLIPGGKYAVTPRKFDISSQGQLFLYNGKKLETAYRCTATLADNSDFKKGDLELNALSKEDKSEIYTLYRRWY